MNKSLSLWFSFFVFGVILVPLQAQITDTAKIPEPTAIAIIELNEKIELVTQQLKNIDIQSNTPDLILSIDSLLPLYKLKLEDQTEAYKNFKRSHPNKVKVEKLINKWGSYNEHLNGWQQTINGYLDKNLTLLESLKRQEKQWLLTYQNAQSENVPYEVLQLIRSTRKSLSSLIIKLNKQNRLFIGLETKVLILKEKITSVLNDLKSWKQSDEFSLLYQRHPTIWKTEEKAEPINKELFDALSSFKENLHDVHNFFISPDKNFPLFLLIILITTIWLWSIKRNFKPVHVNDKNKDLLQSHQIVVHHFLPSLIFLITIIAIVYFSHTPNLLSEIFVLTVLLSAIPVVKTIIHPKFRWLLVFIIFLFIMNSSKSYLWYSSTYYRVFLFIEAVIGIALVIRFTYPYRHTQRLVVNKLSYVYIRSIPVLYILFATSIVFNIFGYTNFTDFLLKLGILGSVLALILYEMLIILNGYTKAVTHNYFSKLENFDVKNKLFIEKRAGQWVAAFSYILTIYYFLHIIDVYQGLVDWLTVFFSEPKNAGGIGFTWGGIFGFLTILLGSFSITSLISRLIDGGALNPLRLPKGIPAIISILIRYFIIAFAIVVALSMLGVDLSKFNLMAGALGLGIGFGMQNIIANFISGLILIFERPIQKNDVVEMGAILGEVKKIGVRSSNIRTFNGAEVVVPNNNLITNEVINWTLSDNVKRIEIKIGAAYGSDLQKVVDILSESATNNKNVLKNPKPLSLFDEFGDSSLNFRLLFWVPVEYGISSKSQVSIAINNRFKEEGITIPFPQRDMNFKKEDLDVLKGQGDNNQN